LEYAFKAKIGNDKEIIFQSGYESKRITRTEKRQTVRYQLAKIAMKIPVTQG
jgi:hypothetical protein